MATVQGSSSSADQPENGAIERGEVPPCGNTCQCAEAVAETGLEQEEPASFEATALGGGTTGDPWTVC